MLIMYTSILSLMFFISRLMQIIFLKKIGRKYTLPVISFTSDLVLFILSIIFIKHVAIDLN